MGDFNYRGIDWSSSVVTSPAGSGAADFLQTVESCFLTQHVLIPTRADAVLDLVLSSDPDLVSDLKVLHPLGASDHNMLLFTVHLDHDEDREEKVTRDYKKGDYDQIRSLLAKVNWDAILSGTVEDNWTRFKDLLHSLIEVHVPLKTSVKKHSVKKPMWMTHKAIKLVRKKRKIFNKYKDAHHPAVTRACKVAKSEIRKAKRNFEKKLAHNIKQDVKSFYAYARSKSKCKVNPGPLINSDGSATTSATEMATSFNDYFASVFTTEDTSNCPTPTDITNVQCSDISFTVEDVTNNLLKLRPDKASGPDNLLPRFLIEIRDYIAYPLYLLFRKSLDDSSVPDDWKNADVSPVFKKGNRNKVENYRPISLTSSICKIFESIIRDAVVSHLETNSLIRDSQHGFRKGRSCLTNLLSFLDKITTYVDSGIAADAVFLDFAKAFDKVPHQRLFQKLNSHGISGKLFHWIVKWLLGRKQRVCLNGSLSNWITVLSGVPQGSVLGPILFLIFINDLDTDVTNWILKFADDTKLFGPVCNDDDYAAFQDDLNRLFSWTKDWQMTFNIEKCKVIHFGRNNNAYSYSLDGLPLSKVVEEKDLGVIISKDLKVSQQCSSAYSKANRILGVINRTISYKTTDTMLRLYKSVVRPHLEYCTAAWSPHYVKDKDLIERIQHRFTRMIPELKELPYMDRLHRLNLWTLQERRVRADLIEVFKMINGLNKVNPEDFFEFDTSDRTRGHTRKLKKNRFNSDLRQHFFTERIINKWNKLDDQTVTASSLNSFKRNLDRLRRSDKMGLFLD